MNESTSFKKYVRVITGGRLHFGLRGWGHTERQFAGVGCMLEQPTLEIEVVEGESYHSVGPESQRADEAARGWAAWSAARSLPAVTLRILHALPQHAGLGSGTQLALAVVSALHAWEHGEQLSATELVAATGRAVRSSVGTHGFLHGGLIVDGGKLASDSIGQLERRLVLPSDWRFVLIHPSAREGVSGLAEERAFAQIDSVSDALIEGMDQQRTECLIPAAEAGQFDRFSESLYEYGRLAGMCFASLQGGPYATPEIARLVERLRRSGIAGVGQSSWGPTIFALCTDEDRATELVNQLQQWDEAHDAKVTLTACRNAGASLEVSSGG